MLDVVNLSRALFGVTALFHFLFVPLTLGLAWILAIMESVYVMTGKEIYKDMTKFWGKVFAINFAMGVVTGMTMEFEFGQNWSFFSYYIGDVFGVPLAVEGISAFMLESAFLGVFFFGWDRLSKRQHLFATYMLAFGSSLSAFWILVANAWMQHPTGTYFDLHTMRMELKSFYDVMFNPVAQVKFVHTVAAGYVTGSLFVLGISAYYLLKGRHIAFAKRSFAIAAGFGLASVLAVMVLGDESGYELGDVQKMKLASIEGEWHTEKAPAAFTLIGLPNLKTQSTDFAVRIPWALGLIATRSFDKPVDGLLDLRDKNEERIKRGMIAYQMLEKIRSGDKSLETANNFHQYENDLGYGLLLKKYRADITQATAAEISLAAADTIPNAPVLYFSFRLMVAMGIMMLLIFVLAFYWCARRVVWNKTWFLRLIVCCIPLPWLAAELGWIVAEVGRQPWTVGGILPTFLSASEAVNSTEVLISFLVFVAFYSILGIVEMFLMVRTIKAGPTLITNRQGE